MDNYNLRYFKNQMQQMSTDGLRKFLNEVKLEYIRRGLRRLHSSDLKELLKTTEDEFRRRNAPPLEP